jgi:sarcosine oxidase
MKIAVIGLGGTGSAALRFSAEAGHEATGFEQFRIGHDRGSSHGESRIIRYLYSDPLYTSLVRDAYPLWRDLERRAGKELLVTTGGIFIGPPSHPEMIGARAALEAARCAYEILNTGEAAKRFPDFRFNGGEAALYQEETGFLRASDCVSANITLASAAGAEILESCAVNHVRQDGRHVVVTTAVGSRVFDRAIVTAGPWMGQMLADHGLPLRVSRQYVFYVGAGSAVDVSRFPAWIDVGSPEQYYGIPPDGRLQGFKLATHQFGPTADPDAAAEVVPEAKITEIEAYASMRFPSVSARVDGSVACLYTLTPDEDFVVDYVPAVDLRASADPGIVMVSGCSGHGFKFTILLGKIAVSMAVGDRCERDIARFSIGRFG